MKIEIKKGIDIPIAGGPVGEPQSLLRPKQIALSLDPFEYTRFKIRVKVGERVKIGQPLVESKGASGQIFVSPAGGVVKEIIRGVKRRLMAIAIELSENEEFFVHDPIDVATASFETTMPLLQARGMCPHIKARPFCLLADDKHKPRDIFVQALESAPFVPSAERQVVGEERHFQAGLDLLAKLTSGAVHLVCHKETSCSAFLEAKNVVHHRACGPHPIANPSVHIQHISPIKAPNDTVWSLSALDVVVLGKMAWTGHYHIDRLISISGEGILEDKRGFFKGRAGFPVATLISERIANQRSRFISGDPLTGHAVDQFGFLGFYDTAFISLFENQKREAFHFFRLGRKKYSATRAYLSGLLAAPSEGYHFTTNQHGEERPFIDGRIYQKVMPLKIPTMELIKAVLAEDFELADLLGLLEVAPEDFALPAFICPSKIEMVSIIKQGIHLYSKELGH